MNIPTVNDDDGAAMVTEVVTLVGDGFSWCPYVAWNIVIHC